MERVENLTEIVRREVAAYHGPALKATTYYFEDPKNRVYAVVIIPDYDYPRRSTSGVVVLARVIDDRVVIDEDTTDRPLWKELVEAGIPREQIVLTYAGEEVPAQPEQ